MNSNSKLGQTDLNRLREYIEASRQAEAALLREAHATITRRAMHLAGFDVAKPGSDRSVMTRVRYDANRDEMVYEPITAAGMVGHEAMGGAAFDGSPHDLLGPPKPVKPRIPLKVPAKLHTRWDDKAWMANAIDAIHAPRTIRHVLEPEAE